MNQEFETILNATISVIEKLPMEVPREGILAGFVHPAVEKRQLLYQNDNWHYPMGQAFYQLGISGIASKATCSAEKEGMTDEQKKLLCGIASVYATLSVYLSRYANVLLQEADRQEGKEKKRLQAISKNLNYLSKHRPESFVQAVQLFYLMWCIRGQDHCCCIGRLDVHCKPFYEADLQAGRITRQEAQEIIIELFEKLNLWERRYPHEHHGRRQKCRRKRCEFRFVGHNAGSMRTNRENRAAC